MRFKLLVFRCVVVQTLLSGLVAWHIHASFVSKMDSFLVGLLRKLLQGRACHKSANEDGITVKYHALTNRQVLKQAVVADVGTELAIARLRWFQSMLGQPSQHSLLFTAMFGRFPFESGERQLAVAHPWVDQLCRDVQLLAPLEVSGCCLDEVQGNPERLLWDDELREDCCFIDVTELRASTLSVLIPPPEHFDELPPSSHDDVNAVDGFECDFLRADGSVCGKRFPNTKALHAHERFSQDGEHGSQLHATALVVTNQCPMWSSIFISIASAKNHLRFALLRGYCPADRALLQIEVAPCFDICCPMCEKVCADHSACHWHVRRSFSLSSAQH